MDNGSGSTSTHEQANKRDGWSDAELQAAVLVYRQLMSGERTNKSAAYRELSARFGRKAEAYERRMQNISAVLEDMGKEWLAGLKPQHNIGTNVRPRLLRSVEVIFGGAAAAEPPAALQRDVVNLFKRGGLEVPRGQERPRAITKQVADFSRDANVKAWILSEARGLCECCGQEAPFLTKDGLPFLEVHHVKTLAEGGSDTIENTVALCPNCHRRLHFAADAGSVREHLYLRVPRLSREISANASADPGPSD